jgi:hypothetical protein
MSKQTETLKSWNYQVIHTDTENKYIQQIRSLKLKPTAESLLKIMELPVRDLIFQLGYPVPIDMDALYLKASRILCEIRLTPDPVQLTKQRERFEQIDLLRYFMAVHKTVSILQGKPL